LEQIYLKNLVIHFSILKIQQKSFSQAKALWVSFITIFSKFRTSLIEVTFGSENINLFQVGDELTIQIENQRRNIFLPNFLARLKVDKANFEGDVLKVSFEKQEKKAK